MVLVIVFPNFKESFELGNGFELCLPEVSNTNVPRCVNAPSCKESFEFGYGVELCLFEVGNKKMWLVM